MMMMMIDGDLWWLKTVIVCRRWRRVSIHWQRLFSARSWDPRTASIASPPTHRRPPPFTVSFSCFSPRLCQGPAFCRGEEDKLYWVLYKRRSPVVNSKLIINIQIASSFKKRINTMARKGRVSGSADPLQFGTYVRNYIWRFLLCLNICHLHLGPFPLYCIKITTISRGGVKINLLCYIIKHDFWPWPPCWKMVPAWLN